MNAQPKAFSLARGATSRIYIFFDESLWRSWADGQNAGASLFAHQSVI
jgi:hypothetical protein